MDYSDLLSNRLKNVDSCKNAIVADDSETKSSWERAASLNELIKNMNEAASECAREREAVRVIHRKRS